MTTSRRTEADEATLHPSKIKGMSTDELQAADAELARRAAALGQPGAVSRTHKAVRTALKGR